MGGHDLSSQRWPLPCLVIYGFSNPIAIMLTLHAVQDETITLQDQMNNFEGEIKCLNLFHRSS